MASISSLSSSTNSALGSLRGYGGLASGLDRDTLIEGMTSGTQAKINKQEQAKTRLQWQMDAYREISDKMISFGNKYTTTMTSKSNLFSDSLWAAASTTVNGTNSKYVSVSGTSTRASNVSIVGVKQMATNASLTTGAVSDRTLKTGKLDTGDVEMSTVGGKDIDIQIGNDTYTISIPYGDGNLTDAASVADAINKAAEKVDVTIGNKTYKLSEFVGASKNDSDNLVLALKDGKGNQVKITDGTALEAMGLGEASRGDGLTLTRDGVEVSKDKLSVLQDFETRMSGKSLTFNYNGTSKNISVTKEALEAEEQKISQADPAKSESEVKTEALANAIQAQLDSAFGSGRIKVEAKEGELSFTTWNPGTGEADGTSTLSVTGGNSALLASHGGMGIRTGESNRLNTAVALKDAGLSAYTASGDGGEQSYSLTVNNKEITFTDQDSIDTIMKKINEADAGVKISYMPTADKFVLEATDGGASGKIDLSGTGADLLFGADREVMGGKDAIVSVKYAGSNEVVDLVRGSNSFDLEGLNVTVSGTFGYREDGTRIEDNTEAVTFTSKVDTDKIVSTVKELVDEYNELVELVNKQMTTRPDRDYMPLSDTQKDEMTEEEIELWENKAKEGILYGSSELRSLANDLRYIVSPYDQYNMSELGLSVSSNWSDNGKLVLDESKLRSALETDLDGVKEAFTKSGVAVEMNGKTYTYDGFATNLRNVVNKYVSTIGTKGILIQKAGSTSSPTSVLNNSILSEMNDIDKVLENLKTRLKSEQDRYISQFSQLETLISQMNSQSSYLSSLGF